MDYQLKNMQSGLQAVISDDGGNGTSVAAARLAHVNLRPFHPSAVRIRPRQSTRCAWGSGSEFQVPLRKRPGRLTTVLADAFSVDHSQT
jgi:hypothetical protein